MTLSGTAAAALAAARDVLSNMANNSTNKMDLDPLLQNTDWYVENLNICSSFVRDPRAVNSWRWEHGSYLFTVRKRRRSP